MERCRFRWVLLVLSVVVCALPELGGGEQGKPIAVSDLMKVYKSDAATFDKQFKGKTVVIEGMVNYADFQPEFGSAKRFLMVEGGSGDSVRCEYADAFEGLRIGHKLQVQGTCQGHSKFVIAAELANCQVVKVFADDYPPSKEVRAEIARLQGIYKVVATEANGEKLEKDADFGGVRIANYQLHLTQADRSYPFGLTVYSQKTPKAFDMHGIGTIPGIYSLEGDILKLCIPDDGRTRPESFATQGKEVKVVVARKEAGK